MVRSRFAALVTFALVAAGCGRGDVQVNDSRGAEETATRAPADATAAVLVQLEGRHGKPGELWIQAGYKVRRDERGAMSKEVEIDIEGAQPGVEHLLSLDGFELGGVITDIKGEGEFELVESGDDFFPQGFVEPTEGSVLRVGELAEVRLLALHKLTDLRMEIAGPGALNGEVKYQVEQLGDDVTTEFKVKLSRAGESAVYPVLVDGESVGDLSIDLGGKGKLIYSTLEGAPFPAAFHAPHAGSSVKIGRLCEGRLRDDLAYPGG